MFSTADGSYMWSVNQITNPSLSITAENAQAVDALGSPIATFDRSKQAQLSAENSLFDLGLYAAQQGKSKEIATATEKIVCPTFEEFAVAGTENEKHALQHAPVEDDEPIKYLYLLKGDGSVQVTYDRASAASADTFAYNSEADEITLPTGLTKGDRMLVVYNYETEKAVAVTGDAKNFPKAGRFVMEVLGADTCDPTTLIHAFVEFPNAKLDANVEKAFTTDGTHPFTIIAQQNYCDPDKILFRIVIPDER